MAVYCDTCDCEIDLSDANEGDEGEVLCDLCLFDEDDEDDEGNVPERDFCSCGRLFSRTDAMSNKLDGKLRCPGCTHVYELNLFTPQDHVAGSCELCQSNKKRGIK